MSQCFLQYVVTCTSDVPFEKMMTTFDPLLLSKMGLVLTNILGEKCKLEVDAIEMIAAESLDGLQEY